MKSFHSIIALVFWLICATALNAQTVPPDDEASKIVVGDWSVPISQPAFVKEGGFHFNADGTFTSFVVVKLPSQEMRVEIEGKWKIEKGVLIEEVTKSTQPKAVPVGLITRDVLINLTDKEYRFRGEKGEESYRTRKPASP